jgi:hypothetical protein
MVQVLLASLFLLVPQQTDTTTFRDAATAELYARARVRHIRQDALVRSYRATVRTRMDASAGRSRFARLTTLLAHESVADIVWHAPNDLKVSVRGARTRAPIVRLLQGFGRGVEGELESEFRGHLVMDRPWFIPRALGDSVRVMGLPEHAALHPLADEALEYYQFAITDSVQIVVPNRTVRAYRMRVEPKRYGPSLVAGDMWIDAESADVVRFSMVFLGDFVWDTPDDPTPDDSADARRESAEVNRYLSVEAMVEYALVDRLYWMPYRQFLAVTAEVPWFVNLAIPARAVTTFSDYEINESPQITFAVELEDSLSDARHSRSQVRLRAAGSSVEDDIDRDQQRQYGYYRAGVWRDGRWEVEVPPADSLGAFQWDTELDTSHDPDEERTLRETFAELSELTEELPPEWTGRRRFGLAWESAAQILRFNRVQGLSAGLGYQLRPGIKFTSILLSGRFGLSDLRPTGSVTWRRDGPVGRFDVKAYRTVREAEAWTQGQGIGNSLNALFVGHDDADYHLVSGASVSHLWNYGLLRNVELQLAYEWHDSLRVETGAAIADLWGDGDFQPNPPVAEGWFFRSVVRRDDRIGVVRVAPGAELLAGDGFTGIRGWASIEMPFTVAGRGGALQLRAGAARGDDLPQTRFRLGGPQTVRGYTYGTRTGREFWSAQLDVAVVRSRLLAPVVFFDIGDTFSSDPLIGVGGGVSLLNGLLRFNVAKGVRPTSDIRFDLLFRAPR